MTTTPPPSEPDSYEAVRALAQARANETGADYGVEGPNLLHPRWTSRRLPLPGNRFGVDLACEVVRPEVWSATSHLLSGDPIPPSAALIKLAGLKTRLLVVSDPDALLAARRDGLCAARVVMSWRELCALADGAADAATPAERVARRAEGLQHFARRSGVELRWDKPR